MEANIEGTVNLKHLLRDQSVIILLQGGSRSGKTFAVLQYVVMQAVTRPKITIDIFRKENTRHANGAKRDLPIILGQLGLVPRIKNNEIFTFDNGSKITFCGADDPQRLRGASRDIAYLNEANEFTREDYDQIAMRTRERIICDFNPSMRNHWLYKLPTERPDKCKLYKTTFRDNIHNLPNEVVETIKSYEHTNPTKWKVYGLGEAATAEELVYPIYDLYYTEPETTDKAIGLDFGYNAPSACVIVKRMQGTLYVRELFYTSGLTTAEIGRKLKELNVGTTRVYCDAAEPDRIKELQGMGLNCHKAVKDVKAGIAFVHDYKIAVHAQSQNVINEIESYMYQRHANGELLDEVIKANDHSLDAMRYAAYTAWGVSAKNKALPNVNYELDAKGYNANDW